MASHKVKTYCRLCHAYCPMEAEVEDGRLLKLGPDTDNPVYGGYTCIKGRLDYFTLGLFDQLDGQFSI